MLEGHKRHNELRNLLAYKVSQQRLKKRLLWEKLKRLEAKQAEKAKQAQLPKLPWTKPRVVQDLCA